MFICFFNSQNKAINPEKQEDKGINVAACIAFDVFIRFYEDQGLLNVERAENGYREYHQADVIRLQEIKLFRKMDISIEEMKLLFEKKKSLQICLEQHLKELDHRKEGLSKMQDMCERLILEHRSLESLNAEDCLEEIEQMEKEGAKFMNVNKTDVHNKKRKGAIIGAAVMTLLMLLTIIIIFWANIQDKELIEEQVKRFAASQE